MTKIRLPKAPPSVEDFIRGGNPTPSPPPTSGPVVEDDPLKNVALRLPASYAAKLQWISDQTGVPQQRFLRDWLLPLIDQKMEELSR